MSKELQPPAVMSDESGDDEKRGGFTGYLAALWASSRVETQGIQPVPLEKRTSTRYFNVFTVWFSTNTNILAITFGMLGPVVCGLSLRDSAIVILTFSLLCTLPPAYFSTLGPKTGMRQMVQARYSFGRWLVTIPVLLNLATLTSFLIIICVIGGECFSAAASGSLSPTVGIVIAALLALFVSFWGFHILHFFETYAWVPAIVAVMITVGCGAPQLRLQSVPLPPGPAQVLSFGGIIASYLIPWAGIASDLTTYFSPSAKLASTRIFVYSYLGLLVPTVLLMTLGAAIGGAIPNVPGWEEALATNQIGGILGAMLAPIHGFGKFLLVVLALSLLANMSSTMYAISLNFQMIMPLRVPRYVYSVVTTAIVIPLAIKAVENFFLNIEHLVALIGYWSASFVGIIFAENVAFRSATTSSYDPDIWDVASALPSGLAAIGAAILSFGLVVPCIGQVWYTGPIAAKTGDIGFVVAFVCSALFYLPLRSFEKKRLQR